MPLDALYYVHALQVVGTPGGVVARLSESSLQKGYDLIQEMSGGDAAPCFSANSNADPQMRMSSMSVKRVLDIILADTVGREVAADLSGETSLSLYWQKGKPFSVRELAATAVHYQAQVAVESMMIFDRLTARQGQSADVDFRVLIGRADTVTDPLVFVGNATLPAFQCDEIYTLAKVEIDSVEVPGVTRWSFDTNADIERIASQGEPSAGYLGVENYKPKLTIETNSVAQIATHDAFRGKAFTTCDCYLRRRRADAMWYADIDVEHIKLSLKPGLLNVSEIDGSKAELSIELYPNVDSGDGQLRTHIIDTATAIT